MLTLFLHGVVMLPFALWMGSGIRYNTTTPVKELDTDAANSRSCKTLSRMELIGPRRENLKACIVQVNFPLYGYP
jgi:hypothetical protein